jgi:hypothetical protein
MTIITSIDRAQDFRVLQQLQESLDGIQEPNLDPSRNTIIVAASKVRRSLLTEPCWSSEENRGNITKWPSLSPEEKQVSSIQMLVISTATGYAMERCKYPHAIVSKMVFYAVSGCEST